MALYLADTTVLIDYLRGHSEVRARLDELVDEDAHDLAVCAVSVGEVFAGLREQDREATARFLSSFVYLDLSFDIARAAGEYRYSLARKGQALKLTDLLIGAAALAIDAVLLTDNVRDFPLAGLRVERLPASRRR